MSLLRREERVQGHQIRIIMHILTVVRKYWVSILSVIVALIAIGVFNSKNSELKDENNGLSVELAHAQIAPALEKDTIRDSIPVATSPVIKIDKASYKRELADKQLIKDLRLRLSQVESQQRSGTEIHDTVRLEAKSSSRYEYSDKWTHLTLNMHPPDTTLAYSVRDSITTIVYREYKHKFLWWEWGTKGYKVKIVNFNPHAKIGYEQYVIVDK